MVRKIQIGRDQAAHELRQAALVLAAHAREVYPHFESPRGQQDIEAVEAAIRKLDAA